MGMKKNKKPVRDENGMLVARQVAGCLEASEAAFIRMKQSPLET